VLTASYDFGGATALAPRVLLWSRSNDVDCMTFSRFRMKTATHPVSKMTRTMRPFGLHLVAAAERNGVTIMREQAAGTMRREETGTTATDLLPRCDATLTQGSGVRRPSLVLAGGWVRLGVWSSLELADLGWGAGGDGDR
jgi:hypothetical protein